MYLTFLPFSFPFYFFPPSVLFSPRPPHTHSHTHTYTHSQDGNTFGIHFSIKTFWIWMAEGTWGAFVCFFFGIWSLAIRPDGGPFCSSETGRVGDLWYAGTVVHLSVTTIVNVRLALEVRHYNWLTMFTFVFSMLAWFVLMSFFSAVPSISYAFASKYAIGMDTQVLGDATAWLTVVLSVTVSILPAALRKCYMSLYAPTLNVIAAELQKQHYKELRPQREYYCAWLCCGKGAYAGVPTDDGKTVSAPAGGNGGGDGGASGGEQKTVEMVKKGGSNNGSVDFENPMVQGTDTAGADAFEGLRQRLLSRK